MTDRTIDDLLSPNWGRETRGVQCPELAANVSIRPGAIRLLPKFGGEPDEDPIKFLGDFLEVCSLTKPAELTEDDMMLRVLSFALKDEAKEWYHALLPGSAKNWLALKKLFLTKYFPASRVNELKRQIRSVTQGEEESLYEFFERFKKLLASCPYHGYAEYDLILYH